mgnify:CR=1 FL=1
MNDNLIFFFQADDGIRYLVLSRGLGDVYKRQIEQLAIGAQEGREQEARETHDKYVEHDTHDDLVDEVLDRECRAHEPVSYTHPDAADAPLCVDLGGRRIINKKKQTNKPAHYL